MISLRDPAVYYTVSCILTVAIEVAVFRTFGWKDKWGLIIVALLNVITSLLLALLLSVFYFFYFPEAVLIVECVNYLLELAILRIALDTDRPLALVTLVANVLSCAATLLLVKLM